MTDFKIGDRVIVHDICRVGHAYCKEVGTVKIVERDRILVAGDTWKSIDHADGNWFASKQCRRFKKGSRRRIWVDKDYADGTYGSSQMIMSGNGPPAFQVISRGKRAGWVEFVEALKKK